MTNDRRRLAIILGGFALALMALLPGAEPTPASCPDLALDDAEIEHLARCDRGARVSVSSVSRTRGHEIFLIDGSARDERRRWSSLSTDEAPRIAIMLPESRAIDRIELHRPKRRVSAAEPRVEVRVRSGESWRTIAPRQSRLGSEIHLDLDPVRVEGIELVLRADNVVELSEIVVRSGPAGR